MVADFTIRGVPRSLVRVPGSGRGQGYKGPVPSVSCDLGRVSSFAASVVIGSYLPTMMVSSGQVMAPSTVRAPTEKLVSTEALAAQGGTSNNSNLRRSLSLEANDGAAQQSKRPRLDLSTPAVNGSGSSSSPRVVRVNVHPSQLQAAVDPEGSHANQEGLLSVSDRRLARARRARFQESDLDRSFEDLLQEQSRLREETRVLRERLSYYIQLRQARETQANQPPTSGI